MTTHLANPKRQSQQHKDLIKLVKGLAFCSPWLIGFLAFGIIPIIASLYYSFTDYSILQSPRWTGIQNYSRLLLEDKLFWVSLGNTLYYTFFSNLLGGFLALTLALLLNMRVRGLAIYRTIYYVPVIVPIVASAVIWLQLFNPQYGILTNVLGFFGIPPIPWLTDPAWSKPSLILMSFWSIGNAVVILLAGLQDVPQEMLEAAELDGASGFQRIIYITIPMVSPVLFFNLVIGLIGGLQIFTQAYIMTTSRTGTLGGPADSTLFYVLYLYQSAFRFFKIGYASALAWVLFVLILIASLLVFKSSSRWVYYGGR